jgi:hypothetical protein
MPNYNPTQSGGVADIRPGDSFFLFNAESPTAPQASVQFARGVSPSGNDAGMTFEIDFAVAPTAVVLIEASNTDIDADYQTVWTSTNLQHDNYTDTARWAFYRAALSTYSAGGALTVKVQR